MPQDDAQPERSSRARTTAASKSGRPDPQHAASLTDASIRTLIHELSNLLDGSLRYLRMAREDLTGAPLGRLQCDDVRRHLEAADHALLHMAELIRATSHPMAGSDDDSVDESRVKQVIERPRPLIEAAEHAVEVLRPLADDHNVTIDVNLDSRLGNAPPAPIYPVLANALRNAIESIASIRAGGIGGTIELRGRIEGELAGPYEVRFEILDDGPGPVNHILPRAFEPGISSKPGNMGLGLALSRDILRELHGNIELSARWPHDPPRPGRRGAKLSFRYRVDATPLGPIGGASS